MHPDDASPFGPAQTDCIEGFSGRCVVLLLESRRGMIQRALRQPLAHLVERGQRVLTIPDGAFGNQRGLYLPVDVAMTVIRATGLQPDHDSITLTGCRGGDRPGSVHQLAEAFAALHCKVRIEPALPED
ncbi:hypothetical protein [Ferrovibrio xuzhouensis]|uniref:Uncharacterized protein n=1 Tax=Ferrovibrio xuzhouensis TaxID=1576914 RepID=A0ABV7VDF5_9PROT